MAFNECLSVCALPNALPNALSITLILLNNLAKRFFELNENR